LFGVQALTCPGAVSEIVDFLASPLEVFQWMATKFHSGYVGLDIHVGIEDDLNRLGFRTPEWRDPWVPVSKDHAPLLKGELSRELPAGHALYGRHARAIARRLDRDDVLFLLDGGPCVAVVHLTYLSQPEQTPDGRGLECLLTWRSGCSSACFATTRSTRAATPDTALRSQSPRPDGPYRRDLLWALCVSVSKMPSGATRSTWRTQS